MPKSEEKIGNESTAKALPASLDIDATVRLLVTDAIKTSSQSRVQIAESMSHLTGQRITEHMLNCYSADSKENHRFPLSFAPAFCRATGDGRLLEAVAEKLGLTVIRAEEERVLRVGEAAIELDRAARRLDEAKAIAGGAR